MTLLFFSDITWTSLYQRPQHLASRLATRWPLLWIEPVTLGHPWSFRVRTVAPSVRALSLPLFPHNARQSVVRRLARMASSVHAMRSVELSTQHRILLGALRAAALDTTAPVCIVQNFQCIRLVHSLQPSFLLFDYIDDAFGFREYPRSMREDWLATIESAHVITVTAPALRQQILEADPSRSHAVQLVSNGVEYERVAAASSESRPADLPPPRVPIIGYVGSVYPWLDFPLLERIVRDLPSVHLVVIGHHHPEVSGELARLQRYPNFSYLGSRPYPQVPAYLHHMDVGIIPFARTRLTAAVNPVKLYEYSAAGLTSVCTNFSDDLQQFADLVLIARSHDEFLAQIAAALEHKRRQDNRARLQEFARSNDWDAKAGEIARLIESGSRTAEGHFTGHSSRNPRRS